MDLLEKLRRSAGSVPWSTFASVFMQNVNVRPDAAYEVIDQLKEWGSHLTQNALLKWAPSLRAPVRCESPDVTTGRPKPCRSVAMLRCDICQRPCCLAHARVDYQGDGICEVCIGEAKLRARARGPSASYENNPWQSARPKPPKEAPRPAASMAAPEALRVLGLKRNAGWETIKRRYRKLVVEYNVDRPQSDEQRAANTTRLKRINEAFGVLRERHEAKAAA